MSKCTKSDSEVPEVTLAKRKWSFNSSIRVFKTFCRHVVFVVLANPLCWICHLQPHYVGFSQVLWKQNTKNCSVVLLITNAVEDCIAKAWILLKRSTESSSCTEHQLSSRPQINFFHHFRCHIWGSYSLIFESQVGQVCKFSSKFLTNKQIELWSKKRFILQLYKSRSLSCFKLNFLCRSKTLSNPRKTKRVKLSTWMTVGHYSCIGKNKGMQKISGILLRRSEVRCCKSFRSWPSNVCDCNHWSAKSMEREVWEKKEKSHARIFCGQNQTLPISWNCLLGVWWFDAQLDHERRKNKGMLHSRFKLSVCCKITVGHLDPGIVSVWTADVS